MACRQHKRLGIAPRRGDWVRRPEVRCVTAMISFKQSEDRLQTLRDLAKFQPDAGVIGNI